MEPVSPRGARHARVPGRALAGLVALLFVGVLGSFAAYPLIQRAVVSLQQAVVEGRVAGIDGGAVVYEYTYDGRRYTTTANLAAGERPAVGSSANVYHDPDTDRGDVGESRRVRALVDLGLGGLFAAGAVGAAIGVVYVIRRERLHPASVGVTVAAVLLIAVGGRAVGALTTAPLTCVPPGDVLRLNDWELQVTDVAWVPERSVLVISLERNGAHSPWLPQPEHFTLRTPWGEDKPLWLGRLPGDDEHLFLALTRSLPDQVPPVQRWMLSLRYHLANAGDAERAGYQLLADLAGPDGRRTIHRCLSVPRARAGS